MPTVTQLDLFAVDLPFKVAFRHDRPLMNACHRSRPDSGHPQARQRRQAQGPRSGRRWLQRVRDRHAQGRGESGN